MDMETEHQTTTTPPRFISNLDEERLDHKRRLPFPKSEKDQRAHKRIRIEGNANPISESEADSDDENRSDHAVSVDTSLSDEERLGHKRWLPFPKSAKDQRAHKRIRIEGYANAISDSEADSDDEHRSDHADKSPSPNIEKRIIKESRASATVGVKENSNMCLDAGKGFLDAGIIHVETSKVEMVDVKSEVFESPIAHSKVAYKVEHDDPKDVQIKYTKPSIPDFQISANAIFEYVAYQEYFLKRQTSGHEELKKTVAEAPDLEISANAIFEYVAYHEYLHKRETSGDEDLKKSISEYADKLSEPEASRDKRLKIQKRIVYETDSSDDETEECDTFSDAGIIPGVTSKVEQNDPRNVQIRLPDSDTKPSVPDLQISANAIFEYVAYHEYFHKRQTSAKKTIAENAYNLSEPGAFHDKRISDAFGKSSRLGRSDAFEDQSFMESEDEFVQQSKIDEAIAKVTNWSPREAKSPPVLNN